jgi:hypothetical protein
MLDLRHARRAADHDHAAHVGHGEPGIAQGLFGRRDMVFLHQGAGDFGEDFGGQHQIDILAAAELDGDRRLAVLGKLFLGFAGAHLQQSRILQRKRRQFGLFDDPAEHAVIEIVAAQRGIAAGGHDLEYAFRQAQDGNVEGAAAEVEHGVDAFGRIVEAIGDRGGGRFVEQAQHVDAGQARGILGGLALCIVEIGRHGDHGAGEFAAQRGLGPVAHGLQDLGRNFHGTLDAGNGLQLDHAFGIEEVVRQGFDVGDVAPAAAHEALDRDDGVLRIDGLLGFRAIAHGDVPSAA